MNQDKLVGHVGLLCGVNCMKEKDSGSLIALLSRISRKISKVEFDSNIHTGLLGYKRD